MTDCRNCLHFTDFGGTVGNEVGCCNNPVLSCGGGASPVGSYFMSCEEFESASGLWVTCPHCGIRVFVTVCVEACGEAVA